MNQPDATRAAVGRHRRRILLAGTALAGGILTTFADPGSARAACIANGTTTVTIDCAANTTTADTTNTTSTNTPTSDRTQSFDANLVGTIHSGVTIDTFGLSLEAVGTSAHTISMTNSGTANYSFPAVSDGVINLAGNGGTVTYGGAGAVNGTSFTTAVVMTNTSGGNIVFNGTGARSSGQGGLSATTSGSGTVTATIANNITGNVVASAVSTTTAAGLNTINMAGGTLLGGNGLVANSSGGIRVDVTGGQIGLANNPINNTGISAFNSSADDTFVTAGGTINAVFWGVQAGSNTGNVRVDVNGPILMQPTNTPVLGTGVAAGTGGNGAVIVNVNNLISAPLNQDIGVSAKSLANATVTVNIGADITAGAGSANAVGVLANGTNGLTSVNMTAGMMSTSGVGIQAISSGTGGVRVNMTGGQIGTNTVAVGNGIVAESNGTSGDVFITGGTIFAADDGILAGASSSASTGNIRVDVGGTILAASSGNLGDSAVGASTAGSGTVTVNVDAAVISANGMGVNASSSGNGAVTVNIGANITADSLLSTTTFRGVIAAGHNGLATVNMTAGTLSATGDGLTATSGGTGGVKINMTGGQIITTGGASTPPGNNAGIVAFTTGPSGNVDVTANTINSFGDGIAAAIDNGANNGTITVTANGAITTSNNINTFGISVLNAIGSTGSAHVTLNNAVIGGVTGVAFNFGTGNTLTVSPGGSIATFLGLTGDAIFVNGSGSIAVSNAGTITGNLVMASPNSSFSNETTGLLNAGPTFTLNGNFTNKGGFAPGGVGGILTTSLTGNFIQTGSGKYLVDVAPSAADKTQVSGSASLAGSVQATFIPGNYMAKSYKIMSASSISGTFASLSTINLPAGFSAKLGYTTTDVDLLLSLGLASPGSGSGSTSAASQPSQFSGIVLNRNQFAVATAVDNFFNTNGTLNAAFTGLVNTPASFLPAALSSLSGEINTGAATATHQVMGQFLDTMLDPFVDGHDTPVTPSQMPGSAAMSFAAEPPPLDIVAAAAPAINKAPPPIDFDRRWSAWGTGFGGQGSFAGNALVGSNDLSVHTGGLIAGLDRRLGPDTLIGVAIGGNSLSYGLAGGLGTGHGEGAQAGVYGSQRFGPAYFSAAGSYAWQNLSTDRNVMVGGMNDHLTARFNAQGAGARVEGGARFAVTDHFGITPYAAGEAQALRLPAYSETDATGLAAFALNYAAKTTTDRHSELGARLDGRFRLSDESMLILRARAAWAYDFSSAPSANATFQALPGFGFTVLGAAPDRNSALASVSAEYRLANGVSFVTKFDGQFGDTTHVWSGLGGVRVAW